MKGTGPFQCRCTGIFLDKRGIWLNIFLVSPRWLSRMRIGLVIRRSPVRSPPGQQHSFMENDHDGNIFYSHGLPLIQEGQLSLSGERMCTSTG